MCSGIAGVPAYDRASERALFIWRDGCSSDKWNVRVTGGTGPSTRFTGRLDFGAPVTGVSGFSLEASDVVAISAGDTVIDFSLNVAAGAQDGFSFTANPAASGCFRSSNASLIYGGAPRTPFTVPLDLRTLGTC